MTFQTRTQTYSCEIAIDHVCYKYNLPSDRDSDHLLEVRVSTPEFKIENALFYTQDIGLYQLSSHVRAVRDGRVKEIAWAMYPEDSEGQFLSFNLKAKWNGITTLAWSFEIAGPNGLDANRWNVRIEVGTDVAELSNTADEVAEIIRKMEFEQQVLRKMGSER